MAQEFTKVLLNIPKDLFSALEEYRRQKPIIPSRNEALRDLLKYALDRKMKKNEPK